VQSTRYSYQILIKLEFSPQIFEKYSKPNFMKIRPVEVELFHADGRTDRHYEARILLAILRTRLKEEHNSLNGSGGGGGELGTGGRFRGL